MIHNFLKDDARLKPQVEVQVGANVPVGCKKHLIFAESPDNQKCVNAIDGECPYLRNEMAKWNRDQQKPTTCPMGGRTFEQLDKTGFKTRPTQLGYFMIPEKMRIALGLDPRPKEIPNVLLISNFLFNTHDPYKTEPLEELLQYPCFDFYLAYWQKSNCICKGDGKEANWYPYSPDQETHMKPRACKYKSCPDFDRKKKCKEVGELYFRVNDAPGFPGLWRFQTRSPKAIGYIIQEIKNIYTALQGRVSYIPLKLSLEQETAHPKIGSGDDARNVPTEVFRLHIRTDFTLAQVKKFLEQRATYLSGGNLKLIASSTSDTPPTPMPPVEEMATADQSEWTEPDQQNGAAGQSASAPDAPPAAPKQPPKKDESKKVPDSAPAKKEAKGVKVVEDECLIAIDKTNSLEELKEIVSKFLPILKQYPVYDRERINKAYNQKANEIKAQKAAPPPPPPPPPPKGKQAQGKPPSKPASAPVNTPTDQSDKKPATGNFEEKKKQIMLWLKPIDGSKALFSETAMLEMLRIKSLADLTEENCDKIIKIVNQTNIKRGNL